MPEFFLELLSEEIPARMQANAADELWLATNGSIGHLQPTHVKLFHGPRRIALKANVQAEKPGSNIEVRGPRDTAPEAALTGFLGKHAANRQEVVKEAGYFLLRRSIPAVSASALIMHSLPAWLAEMKWPKSMRWGSSGDFDWIRPLRRIICLLDDVVVPIRFGPLTASNETEGHRVLAPGAFAVSSAQNWEKKLEAHYVYADDALRIQLIAEGLQAAAANFGVSVVNDRGLVDEVNGLVEWPVPLIGQIDERFMELPPEVRELSMKVNQKYFATRDAAGNPAPHFAFVANLEASDGGAAIIAGNERVLRARLADAEHFWNLDLKAPLNTLLPKLDRITFHAKIGTQGERVQRIAALAGAIAEALGGDEDAAAQARWAGLLCKADLVTGMVGEFPELQGIMGGYYAEQNPSGWNGGLVGPAIKTHYQPKGPSDAVPVGAVAISVALADKIDTLREFFRVGEKPTGSGDPYALRRAALGVIRIILENQLCLPLKPLLYDNEELFGFIIERLRIKLRGEGQRFDILDAVLAAGTDDDLVRVMRRVEAVSAFLQSNDGANLLAAHRRAANILRIEDAKDGRQEAGTVNDQLFAQPAEWALVAHLASLRLSVDSQRENFDVAMQGLATLRPAVDAFFDQVTVNAPEPEVRRNRLRLLAQLRDTMHQVADFSKIAG